MSVVEIAVHDVEDPNGPPLVTLTDADLVDWWFRVGIGPAELGAGRFVVRKDNTNGQAFNLKGEAHLAKITIPVIDPDPLFAWWIGRGDYRLFEAKGGTGAELLTFSGPGVMDIMRQSVLDFESHSGGFSTGAGPRPDRGYWIFTDWTPGRIIRRLIEEDQDSPRSALPDVTHDFTAANDSAAAAWTDTMDGEFRPRIKTDLLTVIRAMAQAAELETDMSAEQLLQAFNALGVDRTSATFAAGKVRFVKGVNIATKLGRTRFSRERATHALVEGADATYEWAVKSGWNPPEPIRQIGVEYPDSNRTGVLERAGLKEMNRRQRAQDAVGFEVLPGDAPLAGLYLPFRDYGPGDMISLTTGASGREYVNSPQRLTAVELSKAAAVSDADAASRIRSLKVAVELNATRAMNADGRPSSVSTRGVVGPHTHGPHPELCIASEKTLVGPVCVNSGNPGGIYASGEASGEFPWEACDLDTATSWGTNGFPVSAQHWGRDYGSPVTASLTRIFQSNGASNAATSVSLYGTDSPAAWATAISTYPANPSGLTLVATFTGLTTGDNDDLSFPESTYRYWMWKANAGGGNGWSAFEIALYHFIGGDDTEEFVGTSERASRCDHQHHADNVIFEDGTTLEDAGVGGHVADPTDAHDASAISFVPTGTVAATNVQAAIVEVAAEAVGAPTTADYLVGTAQGGLSAEIVVGATPGGELGGTWGAPTVDATHSGSTHAATQVAAEATAVAALAAHAAAAPTSFYRPVMDGAGNVVTDGATGAAIMAYE